MQEIIRFKTFCIEQYKTEHDMKGAEVLCLFKRYGVLDYIASFFDVLHTFGGKYLVQDIDLFIQARQPQT
ncbi:MAG: DUF3791 domain-containing protein [Lachnospiraceae bacterium]|jgi:hypothetical protein|nr:DUF3791 domain-containing protein [Lachnospiraceae bacterium]